MKKNWWAKFSVKMLRSSLQGRVLVLTLLIVTIVLWVSDEISNMSAIRALENQIGSQTTMAAHRLANDIRNRAIANLAPKFYKSLDAIIELVPNIIRADIYFTNPEGKPVLFLSSFSSNTRPVEEFELEALKTGESDTFLVEDEESNTRRMVAVQPIALASNQSGLITIISSLKPVEDLTAVNGRIRISKLLITVLLLVGALLWIFRQTVYHSIRHLVETMNRFQAGEITIRVKPRLPGEFGELALHLNHMLNQISQFQNEMKQQIAEATDALAKRSQELERLNLRLLETQKRLIQAERLALVGQLTAVFAHEIGSPLSAVSTHLQLLRESNQLDPRVKERIQLADDEINRVCSIVENLLDRTRRSREMSVVDIRGIIHRAEQLLGPTLQSRQIQLYWRHDPGPVFILGNADELQQLFLNLFNNSLDAIAVSQPGMIEVGITRQEPEYCRIDIHDSGCGIPPEKLEHVFQPFFTTKEFGKGTGLGLAVCKEIVQQHGGTISVESPDRQGASFRLLFTEQSNPKH